MLLFAIIFLSIYAGMHALVFWGISPLLKGHQALPFLTLVWMVVMTLLPIAIRLLDHHGLPTIARPLSWIGYTWMGFLWLAFAAYSLQGLVHLLRKVIGFPAHPLHGPVAAGAILLLVTAVGLYGLYEAHNLQTEQVHLTSGKLPIGHPGIRIVQISDLHLGLIHQQETLAPIISRIRQLHPDLVVATGDIVDAELSHLDGLAELWQGIDAPLGMYAITGNHEYYAGLEQAVDFLQRSGFTLLRGEALQLTPFLTLLGVDDPGRSGISEDAPLPQGLRGDGFTVLLKHRPIPPRDAAGRFDLQLSGHAHRGQIFPFNLLTRLRYPLQDGLSPLSGGGQIYASRGTGTWGPPMRVLSPPELTLFEITPGESP
ncbi:MAG: metallophosphoesterase [Desulfuromonas sp.]|nr:MAG: metallophosphoesterase [Desulfuromonas sp.]